MTATQTNTLPVAATASVAEPMIEVSGLSVSFGDVCALDDVSLEVAAGSVHGLLGHNGAGKTTLVNVLSSLLAPSAGQARVAGFDVVENPAEVRRRIGLTGQFAAVDEKLSGSENLVLIARLLGAGRKDARARAAALLERFDLSGAGDRGVRTYSGGMRRRLDIAASLVGRPGVLFLDEPTTGLDPESRRAVWETIEQLAGGGTTVLLTTQYLDEADRLSDAITILAQGRIIASGTPADLKATIGQKTVTATFPRASAVPGAISALQHAGLPATADDQHRSVTIPVSGSGELAAIVRALDATGIEIVDMRIAEPTLDEVYLSLSHAQPSTARKSR
jgi:ABC-2 type transport system ATP-binding protein